MKKITTTLFSVIVSTILFSQNVKKIENLKDGWDVSYTYTGEVKDGKPNGMGVAKYGAGGSAVRYVGGFQNGMYNGRGTLFFKDGVFLSGEWKNGKLNGKGSFLSEAGILYIGEFVNGVKQGKGVLFYKDNGMICGNFLNDKLSGRGIQIFPDGTVVSDVNYRDDKRNGMGYQYEIKSKTLYAGEWSDDKWVQSGTPPFSSFLKSSSLIGEATDDHILAGPTNSDRFLIDSSYYFDLKKQKKYFGYYVAGHLRNGVIIGDSTRFLGSIGDKGASGYCYDYKAKKYYTEGNFTDDLLNGQILDLDLSKQTAYYGGAVNGEFTGKTYFFNDQGTMYVGDYVKGRLNGNGYRLEANGRLTVGNWEDGQVKKLTSITTADGDVISGNPKTFAEGLNIAIKSYPDIFDNIYGETVLEDDVLTEMEDIDKDDVLTFTYSLVNIPGSVGKNLVAEDFDENSFYYAKFLQTSDAAKAKAKYNELATQLQSGVITNSFITGKQKLEGKIVPPNTSNDKTESEFKISGGDSDFEDLKVWLRLRKSGDDYIVEILIGEKTADF